MSAWRSARRPPGMTTRSGPLLQRSGLRLLRLVRMPIVAINLQLPGHGSAHLALGQHAGDGVLHDGFRLTIKPFAKFFRPQAAGVASVAMIELVFRFHAGDAHLGGVDDDDMVAGIDKRRVTRTILTRQNAGHTGGKASEGLPG